MLVNCFCDGTCSNRVQKQTAKFFPAAEGTGRCCVAAAASIGVVGPSVDGFNLAVEPIDFVVKPVHRFASDGQKF